MFILLELNKQFVEFFASSSLPQ